MLEAYMMIGLPGSGKSTWAKSYAEENNFVWISSDKIRGELFGNEADQHNGGLVFQQMNILAKQNLEDKHNIILDATFLTKKCRKELVSICKNAGAYLTAIVFIVPKNICKERNKLRDRQVPDAIIDKMAIKFTAPTYEESFDRIINKVG